MYFTAAALFPCVSKPASRIRFQDFLFLVQLAAIHIPPPHEAIVLAMQICMGAAKHRCRRHCGWRLPLATPQTSIASFPKHLPNRLVSSILQWLMAQCSQVLTLIDNVGLTQLKSFYIAQEIISRVKRQTEEWKKICVDYSSGMGLTFKICT